MGYTLIRPSEDGTLAATNRRRQEKAESKWLKSLGSRPEPHVTLAAFARSMSLPAPDTSFGSSKTLIQIAEKRLRRRHFWQTVWERWIRWWSMPALKKPPALMDLSLQASIWKSVDDPIRGIHILLADGSQLRWFGPYLWMEYGTRTAVQVMRPVDMDGEVCPREGEILFGFLCDADGVVQMKRFPSLFNLFAAR